MGLLRRAGVFAVCLAAAGLLADQVHRGSAMPANGKITPLASILSNPRAYQGHDVITEGTVRKVCRIAGCWMSIGTDEAKGTMRVTFSKGAFTVPRSSSGSHARVMGRIEVTKKKVTLSATAVDLRGH